ncbi:MAG TPA: GspH/FimT family pseudopilin [Rhodanobacteraceae bacterium]
MIDMYHTHRQHRGFTLIEQIAAVAIGATLMALAVPAMTALSHRTSMHTTENALFTAARLARTSAVTHNADALLCASVDGRHCSHQSTWQHGWIVALDRNRDGQPDTVALAARTPDAHTLVRGSAGRTLVRFQPDGAAAGTNITLLICQPSTDNASARVVIVSNAGRIREARASTTQQARCEKTADES